MSEQRSSNPLLERAERMRQQCLAFANLPPESKTRCGDALGSTREAPTIAVSLADLVDDLVLALQICDTRHARRPADETTAARFPDNETLKRQILSDPDDEPSAGNGE